MLKDKTDGVLETVNAHYSLLPRGAYTDTAGRHTVLHPITRDDRSPLELYEAINAVQIAEAAGADQYAAESMANAKQDLQNAQSMDIHQKEMKQEITYAREAVQTAEDSRIITIRKIKAGDEAAERARIEAARQKAQDRCSAGTSGAQQAADQQAAAQAQAAAAQQQAQAAQQQAQQAQAAAAQAQRAAGGGGTGCSPGRGADPGHAGEAAAAAEFGSANPGNGARTDCEYVRRAVRV